jgi:signal transduction histidine kinase
MRASSPARVIHHHRVGDCTVSADEGRFTQVVANLVGNALQHSPSSTEVIVETRGEPDAVVFCVTNKGTPIPSALRPFLFAPWSRGAAAGGRIGSLGLGLFIVHHLVVAHGGTVDVVSNESEGTRFCVRLPRLPMTSTA